MPRSTFQYWKSDTGEWVTPLTPRNGNPLINYSYAEKMGASAVAEITLSNRSDGTSFTIGAIQAALTDFQRVRIIDGNTKMITFYGRLFDIDQNYDLQYGPTLLLLCRDALFELADMEMTDITNTPIAFGKTVTNFTHRTDVIAELVARFSKDNISTSDTDKFEESYMPYRNDPPESIKLAGGKKSALKEIVELSLEDPINGTLGATPINDALNDSTKFGHDFYVESRFTDVNPNASGDFTEEGTSDLNYFARGSRVNPPADLGLTVKYAIRGGVTPGDRVKNMLPGYDFDQPQQELFTDVNGYVVADGRRTQARKFELWNVASVSADPAADDSTWIGAFATDKFEEGERLITRDAIASIADLGGSPNQVRYTVTGGHSFREGGTVTIAGTTNYNVTDEPILAVTATTFDTEQAYVSSQTGTASSPAYARLHYLSDTFDGARLCLVSIFGDAYKANAPKTAGHITGLTSGESFTVFRRSASDWGIRRSGRLEYAGTSSPESVKNQLVSMMSRSGSQQVRGNFSISGFPHHKAEDATGSATGGTISAFANAGGGLVLVTTGTHGLVAGNSVVISGTTSYNGRFTVVAAPSTTTFTITDTYVADDATGVASGSKITTTSFNPMAFGFRVGMVVEKLSGSGGTRVAYGYAEAVTSTTITVELNGATATQAWSHNGGDYYRIVVPERPGMQVRVINPSVGIAGSDHTITEVKFTEGPGQLVGNLRTAGENSVRGATPTNASANAERSKDEGLPGAPVSSQVSFTYDGDWDAPAGGLNVEWDGARTVTAAKGPLAADDTNVSSLILSDGREFNIGGNTSHATRTQQPDAVSLNGGSALTKNVPYIIYFDVLGQTEDDDPGEPDPFTTYQFSIALKSAYDAEAASEISTLRPNTKADDILIAYVTLPTQAAIDADSQVQAEFILLQNAGQASMVAASKAIADYTIETAQIKTGQNWAGTITVSDNESTNQNNALIFGGGADLDGGNLSLQSDGDLHYNPSTGMVTATGFTGALTGTASTATLATHVTITDNEATDENNAVIFAEAGDLDGGDIGLESDGNFYYNPYYGALVSPGMYPTYLNAGNGSAASPSHTFSGDIDTGMYRNAANTIGFSTGGTSRLLISSAGVHNALGAEATPSYNFIGDNDTGMYRHGVDEATYGPGFSAGGSLIVYMSSAGLTNIDGSASAPSYNFTGDTNTGMYQSATNKIGFAANGVGIVEVQDNGLYPIENDHVDLGSGSKLFDDIYGAAGVVNTSDLRLKENIQKVKLGLEFINDLNPITYKKKNKNPRKLDATHYGIIAQEVIETLKDYEITSLEDFAGIVYNEEDEGTSYYGARYTEFIPILMKAIQELSAEVKELKEKI